jgi:hypothetical protein
MRWPNRRKASTLSWSFRKWMNQHPARQHIHCVLRTPNGNDLLRQHSLSHAHA